MHMLREGGGLNSRANCCPTICLSRTIYCGATKKQLGKGFCFLGLLRSVVFFHRCHLPKCRYYKTNIFQYQHGYSLKCTTKGSPLFLQTQEIHWLDTIFSSISRWLCSKGTVPVLGTITA